MSTSQSAVPSVLGDPVYRRPQLPGMWRPVDLVLGALAMFGMALAFSQGMTEIAHADPLWIDATELKELARGVARSQEHFASILVYLGVGLFGCVMLITRLLYRVHRCELLLRWSGVDESELLARHPPEGTPEPVSS